MKFNIDRVLVDKMPSPVVGNVYSVRGGKGAKHGHMNIIISITEGIATVLSVTPDGDIVGASNYCANYFADKCPIAFCKAIETLSFDITTL